MPDGLYSENFASETVWKIGMDCEVGVQEAAKRSRKSPDRAFFAAREACSRGLRLFPKQFRKGRSANFGFTAISELHEERPESRSGNAFRNAWETVLP